MSKDFHEAYTDRDVVGPPPERSTGFVFAAVTAIVAVIFRDNTTVLAVAGLLSLGFLAVSLTKPSLLGPLNILWFRFSLLLHKIVNPIILGLMFIVAIVPFGLVMRIFRDPMRRRPKPGPSYWIEREPRSADTHSMTNQF